MPWDLRGAGMQGARQQACKLPCASKVPQQLVDPDPPRTLNGPLVTGVSMPNMQA